MTMSLSAQIARTVLNTRLTVPEACSSSMMLPLQLNETDIKSNYSEKEINESSKSNSNQNPNLMVYQKMEYIVSKMQNENNGVPIRTVRSFLSKIPSVFTGQDLISWLLNYMSISDHTEAIMMANRMASYGYYFPINDHILSVKNDSSTYYRFQTPYFWPSKSWSPENTDYAVYLCKRTMQNKTQLELKDYEAENLARLQKMFSQKWEYIFMQAEAQSKVDKKRDKYERQILDTQERAFWDVYRPPPGSVNIMELDIKKVCRIYKNYCLLSDQKPICLE